MGKSYWELGGGKRGVEGEKGSSGRKKSPGNGGFVSISTGRGGGWGLPTWIALHSQKMVLGAWGALIAIKTFHITVEKGLDTAVRAPPTGIHGAEWKKHGVIISG